MAEKPTYAAVTKIAHEILAYLEAHPDAADTVHGISTWWVSKKYGDDLKVVQLALDVLLVEQKLLRHDIGDGHSLYRAAHNVQSENDNGFETNAE